VAGFIDTKVGIDARIRPGRGPSPWRMRRFG
jgi:hypothetical protein